MGNYYHLERGDWIFTPHGKRGRIIGYSEPNEIGDPCWLTIRWDSGNIADSPATEVAHWRREENSAEDSPAELTAECSPKQLERWELAAHRCGVSLDRWVQDCLDGAAKVVFTSRR